MLPTESKKRIERIVDIIVSRLFFTLLKYFLIWCLVLAVLDYFELGYDSTDSDQRSGMFLRTDALTGCQYLGSPYGGLTPRLNQDGTHVCEGG